MAKTYAAFYLPPEEPTKPKVNEGLVSKFSNALTGAWKNVSQIVSNNDYEMLKDIARNMNIQGGTEFSQRYAVGALTKIINGQAVTNKTMLDSLFNMYAPALNASLAQSEFNSIVEMRNAVQAGNINVSNFVQGLSSGLTAIQNTAEQTNYSKYGEEIPIDVVTKCIIDNSAIVAKQRTDLADRLNINVKPSENISITLNGNVKNENAELWNMNEFSNKLVDIMLKKEKLYFRVGKSIYENCIISLYQPTIKNIYDIKFEMDIKMQYQLNTYSQNDNPLIKMNPRKTQGDSGNFNYNIACKEVYKGIMG